MSELQLHPLHSSTSNLGLDPNLEVVISRIVEIRLQDSNNQFAELSQAWKHQEAEMLNRETAMYETIETLNSQLAAAHVEAANLKAAKNHQLVSTSFEFIQY